MRKRLHVACLFLFNIYIVKRFDSLKSTDKSLVVVVVVMMMMMMIIVVVKNNLEKRKEKRKEKQKQISDLALHLINFSTFSAI